MVGSTQSVRLFKRSSRGQRGEIGFETAETPLVALKQTAMWRGEERARNRVTRN